MSARHLALLVALAGCRPDVARTPLPSSVVVTFSNPAALALPPDLRLALVFTHPDLLVATKSVVSVDPAAPLAVDLTTPPADWETGLDPVEAVTFPSLSTVNVFRPRFVLYEDTDASGSPTLGDHIWAIDTSSSGASVAAVLDLETTLARMTYEESQSYYAATGGLFTPFMRVMGSRGFLQLIDGQRAGPLTLKITDSPIPEQHLRCRRDPVYLSGDPLAPSSRVTVQVDLGVDRAAFCGSTLPDCTLTSLVDIAPPDVTPLATEGHRRVAMCRQDQDVQTLVVQTSTMKCESCSCTYDTTASVWVATIGSVPSWWPCGAAVELCTSSAPLYQIDEACLPATP